jgi:hypothetical protein
MVGYVVSPLVSRPFFSLRVGSLRVAAYMPKGRRCECVDDFCCLDEIGDRALVGVFEGILV